MIEITNLSKKFGRMEALRNISVTCRKGECIALIGPNGSGKTTLIKCILGMVVPDEGLIAFNNKTIAQDWKYRDQIGFMPQIGRYPENMSIGQVFTMIKDIRRDWEYGPPDLELYAAYELEKIKHKRMGTLSGGTRQKVSAALAFLFHPEVLILDEPTAGLDPLASELLKNKIQLEKNKGRLILISSHVLSELDSIISAVIYLNEGALVFHKQFAELQEETGETRLSGAIARVMQKKDNHA